MGEHRQNREHARRTDPATDIVLSAFALLRLQPSRWRQLLRSLLSPAIRLHRLRDARTRLWTEVISAADCQRLISAMTDTTAAGSGACGQTRECRL